VESAPVGSNREIEGMVIQSLIGALLKMPKMMEITIRIHPCVAFKGMGINMWPPPPGTISCDIQISHASISGHLAAELQDVIWSHREHELEVICTPGFIFEGDPYAGDDDDDWSWDDFPSPSHKCKKWNRQKNGWDRFASAPSEDPREPQRRNWVLLEDSDEPERDSS